MLKDQLLKEKNAHKQQKEVKKFSAQNLNNESTAMALEILEDEVLDYVFGNDQFYLDNGEC